MKAQLIFAILTAACTAQNIPPVPTPGNVTLLLDEYNRLTDLAEQRPKPAPAPPVPHILKSAQMNLQVSGESVFGTVTIEGEVLATGELSVPLVRGMVVRQASQQGASGQPARDLPVTQQAGEFSALLSGPGAFAVTLDAAVPLMMEPGQASFNLPSPAAGAVRLALSIPGEQTQVNLSSGLIVSRATHDGRTFIEAALMPGAMTHVWWAARLGAPQAHAAPKEVRFLSDVKTLITVGESELSMAALAEITVVQGEPSQFTIHAPEGYELTGATGPTLISSEKISGEMQKDSILLTIANPALRSHQFLISLARNNTAPSAEVPLITFEGTQRETGEVLVEGEGAMELTATDRGALRRMDLREASPYLRSMARGTLHTAFRYQKKPAETPEVALEWVRFPNSKMLSAVAQQAVVTTLVTSEGRSLTEIKLTLRNQSQPFLKVDLPPGASILSAEVAGEKVKPVQGSDGSRVPLLRPGFHPVDAYTVSFVFLHAGAPFAKKGGAELALPKLDLPIARVEWEVFLPQQYKMADFGGDALPARLLQLSGTSEDIAPVVNVTFPLMGIGIATPVAGPGALTGVVTDPAGGVIAGAKIMVRNQQTGVTYSAVTNNAGQWMVANVPSGRLTVICTVQGFKTYVHSNIIHDATRTTRVDIPLQVGSIAEQVTVSAESTLLKTESAELSTSFTLGGQGVAGSTRSPSSPTNPPLTPPSDNVTDLQRRVAGVLPIAVNVPRAGNSYRFVRALAVDEETRVTFRYRTR